MGTEFYGETASEKLASENEVARQIVREINRFGISDRQRWMVIHLLAMELENVEEMKSLTKFISDTKGRDLFVTRVFTGEDPPDPNEEVA